MAKPPAPKAGAPKAAAPAKDPSAVGSKPKREKAPPKPKKVRFLHVAKLPADTDKVPPQVRFILTTVHTELTEKKLNSAGKGISRADVVVLLEAKGLVTRQPVKTVLNFYLGSMLKDGYLVEEERQVQPEAKVAA